MIGKILWFIIGLVVLIPLATVIAVLGGATLLGGWLAIVVIYGWQVLLAMLIIYIVVKLSKHYLDK